MRVFKGNNTVTIGKQFIVEQALPKGILGRILSVLALLVSWYLNKSILWGIFHWIFAGPYLLYCLLKQRFANAAWFDMIEYYLN